MLGTTSAGIFAEVSVKKRQSGSEWKEELKHGPDVLPCYREKDSQGSSELATKLAHYQKMLSISEKKKKENVSGLLVKK